MAHSTRPAARQKPKPRKAAKSADFPLYQHKSGHFAKKVRGRVHYFGKDRDAALARWLEVKDDLLAGRTVRRSGDSGPTLADACNGLLAQKQGLVDTGEMSPRTWQGYHQAAKLLTDFFGRNRLLSDFKPDDFVPFRASIAATRGPVATGNVLRHVRGILKWAYDHDLTERPLKVGKALALPSQKVLRAERQSKGPRMFDAAELRTIIAAADVRLKPLVLLGINCGFGQSDCARLTFRCIDLDAGWHTFPRPKTAIERRCPLWPETLEAIKAYLAVRKPPHDRKLQDRVFLTRLRDEWVRVEQKADGRVVPVDSVGLVFGKVLRELGLKRPGVNFYALRHTFETIAGDSGDQIAVSHVMGHAPATSDMSSRYREKIADERLVKVTEHVRAWLALPAGTEIVQ